MRTTTTTTKQSLPKATPTAVSAPAAEQKPRPRNLAPVQQMIADEVADMLVNGGDERITDKLISAAARHAVWRWASSLHGPHEGGEIAKRVDEFGPRRFSEYKADMLMAWREQRRKPAEVRPEPKTVAERIRENILDELRNGFGSFLTKATPEECCLMLEVLQNHSSANHGRDAYDELPLGQAFDYVLGKAAPDWVQVPHKLRAQVGRYIACLKAAEDCTTAA